MKKIIFLNGKFIPLEEARVSVLEPGFLYGYGLFETMRSLNGKIIYFDAHLKRLKQSCQLLNLRYPYSLAQFKKIINQTIKLNDFRDAYVRLTLWKSIKSTHTSVIVKKYQPYSLQKYKKGFRACIFSLRQSENSLLARLKTTNYLFYQLAYQEAKKKRFDEAIILNSRGYIAEASRRNIFLVKDNALFTPALECGCLDGITRKVVLDLAEKNKFKVYTGNFTVDDLSEAEEVFLTNSLMGLMPLVSLETKTVGQGRCGKITQFLSKKYNCLLK